MLLLFTTTCKCQALADILVQIQTEFGDGTTRFAACIISLIGLFICIFGTKYSGISLTTLCTFGLSQIASTVRDQLIEGKLFVLNIPDDYKEIVKEKVLYLSSNKLLYLIAIFVMAALLSYCFVFFIHTITLGVIVIAVAFCYTEGYHLKMFNYLNVTNQYVQWGLLFVMLVVILYFYFKIPKMIMAVLFAFIGSVMVTYGIDILFNMGWRSLELFSNSLKEFNIDHHNEAVFVCLLTFAFSVGAQFLQIFTHSGK